MIVFKGVDISVPVFEQLLVLCERIGYWKSHQRVGRLVLRVDLHVVLRVLGVFQVVFVSRCYGEIVADGIEWYARSDPSVFDARVRDVDFKYRSFEDDGWAFTLRHWIEKKPYYLAEMVIERQEKHMGEIRHCMRYGNEPCINSLSWYGSANDIPKIDLGRLGLLLEECAVYVKWVDMEHLKAMSVVNRGLVAVEIAQAYCEGHRSQAVQLALALNLIEVMWLQPSVAAGLQRELRRERQLERLSSSLSCLG